MSKVSNAQIQSIQTKINILAKERGVLANQLMTIFLLERAAARLMADDQLQKNLIFKGGYVGVRVYNSPRYTTDLDAVVRGMSKDEAAQKIKVAMSIDGGDGVWFQFESAGALKAQGDYGGIGLVFRGGLGNPPPKITKAQLINIDLGIGDPVTPSPLQVSTHLTIGEGSLTWQVYPIETILAEKLHAMIKLGDRNSRSKDVYDIHLFLPKANPDTLREALKSTFSFRGDPLPSLIWESLTLMDTSILQRGWAGALSAVKDAPQFEISFDYTVDFLKSWKI